MRLAGWQFAPRLIPSLAAAVLLPILMSLGFWQLDRGVQKSALAEVHHARAAGAPEPLTGVALNPEQARYRPVTARGSYHGEAQVVHAYQGREGRWGFHVYTPFELSGAGVPHTVLVNRGWVPHGRERLEVPPLPVPEGTVELRGMLDRYPSVGLRLGPADDGLRTWPRVVQYMDQVYLEEALQRELRPFVLLLDDKQPGALTPNWNLFYVGPERHYGYAVQWFGLSLALLIIYIVVNTRWLRPDERE